MSTVVNIPRDSTLQKLADGMMAQNAIMISQNAANIKGYAPVMVPYLINQSGGKTAFLTWCSMCKNASSALTLNEIVTAFYDNAKSGKVYTSRFYQASVSSSDAGEKLEDNASMVCEPSTNSVAGRDDYADLALFMPINVNYTINATTLECDITEIEGVTDGFSLTSPNGLVGVLQMGAWVRRYRDNGYIITRYSDTYHTDFQPLPECVKASDNKFRSWCIHSKYVMGIDSDGKPTSASGLSPAVYAPGYRYSKSVSHDGQITLWRQLGAAYSGGSLCDRNFMELMFEIKYAKLGSTSTMAGCRNYTTSYKIAYAESDTTRILLNPTEASYYLVGSTISVGTGTGREAATGHDVVDHHKILRAESVTISDTTYTALYLDVDATFTTTTALNVIPEPWYSGSTDLVLGNDGSPYSNTSGKEACKIQGIEFMVGVYEVVADAVIKLNEDKTADVYLCRKAANITSAAVGTDSYVLSDHVARPSADGWNYISECGESLEGMLVPTVANASSSTRYRAGLYMEADTVTGLREWLASCDLWVGGDAGLPALAGYSSLGYAGWHIGARASGSGANRGEFAA